MIGIMLNTDTVLAIVLWVLLLLAAYHLGKYRESRRWRNPKGK